MSGGDHRTWVALGFLKAGKGTLGSISLRDAGRGGAVRFWLCSLAVLFCARRCPS